MQPTAGRNSAKSRIGGDREELGEVIGQDQVVEE